jgi:hypothetical protein
MKKSEAVLCAERAAKEKGGAKQKKDKSKLASAPGWHEW